MTVSLVISRSSSLRIIISTIVMVAAVLVLGLSNGVVSGSEC